MEIEVQEKYREVLLELAPGAMRLDLEENLSCEAVTRKGMKKSFQKLQWSYSFPRLGEGNQNFISHIYLSSYVGAPGKGSVIYHQ